VHETVIACPAAIGPPTRSRSLTSSTKVATEPEVHDVGFEQINSALLVYPGDRMQFGLLVLWGLRRDTVD